MARLSPALLALAWFWPAPAAADPIDRWSAEINEAAARFGIPVDWVRRVIRAESAGRTTLGGRPIVSRAGAMGLMQLMPATWTEMRAALGLGRDPHAPRDNILAGTYYLRLMYDRFGYPGLFAAYNAGPGAYAAYLAGNRRLPAETRAYVANVAGPGAAAGRPRAERIAPVAGRGLFAFRVEPVAAGQGPAPLPAAPAPAGLFVRLRGDSPR